MITLPHVMVKTYGGLEVRDSGVYSFSGSGGTPPKKPHAPVRKPKKKPKK